MHQNEQSPQNPVLEAAEVVGAVEAKADRTLRPCIIALSQRLLMNHALGACTYAILSVTGPCNLASEPDVS
jgi:hypothetical protein